MRNIIIHKFGIAVMVSVVSIASSCTKNTSSNSRIDQACDNFNSVFDTAHRDSSNFLTQLGISPSIMFKFLDVIKCNSVG